MAKKVHSAAAPVTVIETVPAAAVGKVVEQINAVEAAGTRNRRRRPAGAPVPDAPKLKINRDEYSHCIWFGNSTKPKLWLKSLDEVGPALNSIAPSKLKNVHVGIVKPVGIKITPTFTVAKGDV
jgi:hypothetical protein